MKSNKKYLTELIGFNEEKGGIEMNFKDYHLEEKFRKYNYEKELYKSLIFCICCFLGYTFQVINSIILNKKIVYSTIGYVVALIIEIFLAKMTSVYKTRFKFVRVLKYFRFFLMFFTGYTFLVFSSLDFNPTLFLRFIYGSMFALNLIYIFYLDYNIILLISVAVFNCLIFFILGIKNQLGNLYFLPEMIVNLIYFSGTFLIKRYEFSTGKEIFFELFKNENYIDYIQEIINSFNTSVISINSKEVLFINEVGLNYLKVNNFINQPEIVNSSSNLGLDDENTINNIKDGVDEFLKSLILKTTFENNSIVFNVGKTLNDIAQYLLKDDNFEIKQFKRLGIFNSKEKSLEIHVRKIRFNEDILEIFIIDVSEIKLAEKNNIETKFKKKILAKLAHEFKTPLITIISLIKNIVDNQMRLNENEIQIKLNHINNFSNYVILLISDIIQYVSDSIDINFTINDTYLRETLEFSFDVLKTLIQCNENKANRIEANIEIDKSIDLHKAITDENRLKQIILNLISNAVKFTVSGSIKIKASYITETGIIEISVKDTGFGIKEEDIHLIFQENIQLNINQEYNIKGSGLGLSISKNLAKCLGHNIGFNSQYGVGSEFYIRIKTRKLINNNNIVKCKSTNDKINDKLELSKDLSLCIKSSNFNLDNFNNINNISQFFNDHSTNKNNFDLIKTEEIDDIIYNHEFQSMSSENSEFVIETKCFTLEINKFSQMKYDILVVDDHKLVRDNTINLLKNVLSIMKLDYFGIVEGSDGIDLLNKIRLDRENRIKLIFLDENMEYLNGSEAVNFIRKWEECKKIQKYEIISVTAFDDKETRQRILSSGVNSVLFKPCTKSDFMKIFEKFSVNN